MDVRSWCPAPQPAVPQTSTNVGAQLVDNTVEAPSTSSLTPRDARLRHTGALLLLAIGTLIPTFVHAGVGVWTSGGPIGGETRALAINPVVPAIPCAGTGAKRFSSPPTRELTGPRPTRA